MLNTFDFWSRVNKTSDDGCWLWTGQISPEGSGFICVGKRKIFAHRYIYEMYCGPLSRCNFVLQTCGNKLCVQPSHLFVKTLEMRFWEKVDKSKGDNECWIWTGSLDKKGYGRFSIKAIPELTHRVGYILTYGEIPDGLLLLHRCDNPPCCNPNHMFLGTYADNVADMIAKGRQRKDFSRAPRGEQHHKTHFTWDDIREMRRLHREEHVQYATLGRKYAISTQSARRICLEMSWANDPEATTMIEPMFAKSYGHRN